MPKMETDNVARTEIAAAIAGLALAMGQNGALGRDHYGAALRRLSQVLGEPEDAEGSSPMIDRVIAVLKDGEPGNTGRSPSR